RGCAARPASLPNLPRRDGFIVFRDRGLCRSGDPPPAVQSWPLLLRSRRRAGFQARLSRASNPCPEEADRKALVEDRWWLPPLFRTAPALDVETSEAEGREVGRHLTTPLASPPNRK